MHSVDPRWFLPSADVKPFILDNRIDLVAADAPTTATGRFIAFSLEVPDGQAYIIKTMAFYAMERVNAGLANETAQMMNPVLANGFFAYEPQVNGNAPWVINLDYNSPQVAAGPPLNSRQRQRAAGIGFITDNPWYDIQSSWVNPMFQIVVGSQQKFQIIFSILPPPTVNPLPVAGQYAVGGAGGAKRVDFAGAMIAGVQTTQQRLDQLLWQATNTPGW